MKKHRGYSLIECLVTIALIGTVMTTVAVSMSGMQRACHRAGEETSAEMELQRLAAQLRADAHEALSGQQEDGAGTDPKTPAGVLRLVLNDEEEIRYTLGARTVNREHRRNKEVVHRESYRIPAGYAVGWKLDTGNPLPIVSLQFEPEPGCIGSPTGIRALEVAAVIGVLGQPAAAVKTGEQS